MLDNPRLSMKEGNLTKLRYMYKIPSFVKVHASEAHERVDWVILCWVAL